MEAKPGRGYDLSAGAAREPWLTSSRDTPENRALRRLLIDTAIDLVERETFIEGMFWWKWMPGRVSSRDFAMHDPEAREVLRDNWTYGR